MSVRRCRECGCTDEHACTLDVGLPMPKVCSWASPDVCSACVPGASPDWLHPAPLAGVSAPLRDELRSYTELFGS